jgi:hypothetical protein
LQDLPVAQIRDTEEITESPRLYRHRLDGGIAFWAVSDVNGDELREFVSLLRSRIPSQ